jgi:hypothetical protein
MPASLWPLPDALDIAVRLIGLLPARPAMLNSQAMNNAGMTMQGLTMSVRRWPMNKVALIAACVALVISFAMMMTRQ